MADGIDGVAQWIAFDLDDISWVTVISRNA